MYSDPLSVHKDKLKTKSKHPFPYLSKKEEEKSD
jgi:hypothetical protein